MRPPLATHNCSPASTRCPSRRARLHADGFERPRATRGLIGTCVGSFKNYTRSGRTTSSRASIYSRRWRPKGRSRLRVRETDAAVRRTAHRRLRRVFNVTLWDSAGTATSRRAGTSGRSRSGSSNSRSYIVRKARQSTGQLWIFITGRSAAQARGDQGVLIVAYQDARAAQESPRRESRDYASRIDTMTRRRGGSTGPSRRVSSRDPSPVSWRRRRGCPAAARNAAKATVQAQRDRDPRRYGPRPPSLSLRHEACARRLQKKRRELEGTGAA